jgi:hypothetical protein
MTKKRGPHSGGMTTADGKPLRKVYNDSRVIRTTVMPDGKTITTKSTGMDIKGRHYFTASDSHRHDFRVTGKVPFFPADAVAVDYAGVNRRGKADLLTKEPTDKQMNDLSAKRKAAYEAKQAAKAKEKRDKAKKKTRKKLTTVPGGSTRGGGGGGGMLKLVTDRLPKLARGGAVRGAVLKGRGGKFKGIF